MQDEVNLGCSEEFAELCALSTSNSLTAGEEEQLEAHVASCGQCALLLNQYRALASTGMAKMAALRAHDASESEEKMHGLDHLKAKLLSTLAPVQSASVCAPLRKRALFWRPLLQWQLSVASGLAAATLFAVAAGYLLGSRYTSQRSRQSMAVSAEAEANLKAQLADVQSQLTTARQELLTTSDSSESLQARSEKAGRQVQELETAKAALETKIKALVSDNQRQSAMVAGLMSERDAVAKRLADSENLLQSVRQELKSTQDDRQRVVLRASSLELQVDSLTNELHERVAAAQRSEQYLASDRDVRELMGARQLYIADVFDVDARGETRKPFGRVFYTKGKSLIFYAFDLDKQPGYKEAKTFQAWGSSGSSHATPVSLGIFYLDSEKNRRWALKFEDPKVLEEVNALFVTLEPKGGSRQPTNKPFLLAYLRTATANHP
jgi:hypothetical protein